MQGDELHVFTSELSTKILTVEMPFASLAFAVSVTGVFAGIGLRESFIDTEAVGLVLSVVIVVESTEELAGVAPLSCRKQYIVCTAESLQNVFDPEQDGLEAT